MHEVDTFALALGGLLHDIGKFMLRAHESGIMLWNGDAQADFKYKHAMLSDAFVSQFVPKAWQARGRGLAGNHHEPKNAQERIVQLADWLAAGERDDDPDVELPKASRQQLTVFSAVSLNGRRLDNVDDDALRKAFLPLQSLSLDENSLFPSEALSPADADRAYRALWEDFRRDVEALRDAHASGGELPVYLESLQLLMQRYLWSVPSAYWGVQPDISLYDHSRITAALAAVLAKISDEDITRLLNSSLDQSDEEVALLVGGDISGVQDFIYTITSRGATSALRGRSFYLQLLTEAIARYVLRRLHLPVTNLIYHGGGNFYLLARARDADQLQTIQRDISRILLQHHRGDLYVALAGVPLTARDFFGSLSHRWGELTDAQQRTKRRRFAELDKGDLEWLFEPIGHGGNEEQQCQVCGREHRDTKEDDNGVRKCRPCRSYEALGRDLRKARFLALTWLPVADEAPAPDLKEPPGGYTNVLAAFGMKAKVFENLTDAPLSDHPTTLLAIKDEALTELHPGPNLAVGRRFLVNVTPQKGDAIKTFEDLAEDARGAKRLGVLRMDVDNLGRIFSEGLGDKATMSRVAGLSFAISLYFEGWVEQIAEEMNRQAGRDVLYSIYSGGDDLFFVGSWDWIVRFAQRVRKDLERYTAHHPVITASAGIVLAASKYPLAQAAREAGEAEHAAKSHPRWDEEAKRIVTAKDAISFLGQVQPWRTFGLAWTPELSTVAGLAALLDDMVSNGASKSLIRNLSHLYAQYEAAERRRRELGEDVTLKGEPQPLWGPWMWRGVYQLTRAIKRTKNPEITSQIKEIRQGFFPKRHRPKDMAWMGLAARWAELLTR
ncbi:MAG TPA: type III-A CRISPR-associated protein Cas10/Csm1 [Caldilineales bacterium]|nr:type III-A CRISPR-associated protein Cas10/Csm1 [Caldilineales bacterium]